jgi:hypothetical protein
LPVGKPGPGEFPAVTPDGAHESGPGTAECDGVGIDDVLECVAASL